MSDTFRKTYKALHADSSELILMIKEKAEELECLFNKITSREMSIAKTNLETAIMWSTKAVVLHDEDILG